MNERLAIMFLLVLLAFSVFLPNAFAPVPSVFYASYSTNYPVIDGYVTDPEWNDANSYEISLDGTIPATVYFKHCNVALHHIYIGLKVSDGDHDSDRFGFFFDEGNDTTYGSGTRDGVLTPDQEDSKSCFSPAISGYTTMDGCYKEGITGVWCTWMGGDFSAACVFVGDHWECEFAIPFVGEDGVTGDVSDLVCTIADCVGIKIFYSTSDNAYYYPAGDQYQIETYTILCFAPSPGVIPEVPLGTVVASAAMIIALIGYFAIPKLRKKQISKNP